MPKPMRPTLISVLNRLFHGESTVEIPSNNLDADHKAFDKSLRVYGEKKNIKIAKDRSNGTLIFHKKS
jgi:hypothetical protein